MRFENFNMSDKKKNEALEAIKAQNLNQSSSNDIDKISKSYFPLKDQVPNTDFDMLLSFTEDAFEELEEANVKLESANKKLEAQNKIIQAYSMQQEHKIEELKFTYQQLEHFIQVGSHDLKEPLRNIANFSQLLNDNFSNNLEEEGQSYLQFILNGTNQLHNTLNDFIDYLQIDGQFNSAEIVELNSLILLIEQELKSQFGENSFKLTVEKLPSIAVNRLLFIRLVKELITNAIKFKYTEPPVIEISCCELEDEFWLFKIKDNGVGLSENLSKKIFTPFQRIKNHDNNENRPIGLAVCKKIVKLHKGDIWYDSSDVPGEGTTFLFTINNIARLPYTEEIPEIEDGYDIPG